MQMVPYLAPTNTKVITFPEAGGSTTEVGFDEWLDNIVSIVSNSNDLKTILSLVLRQLIRFPQTCEICWAIRIVLLYSTTEMVLLAWTGVSGDFIRFTS